MAVSKAKKHRQKLEREGRRNPELSRSPFALVDLRSKRTKTKQEQLNKNKHKNQYSFYKDDGSFYFMKCVSASISKLKKTIIHT